MSKLLWMLEPAYKLLWKYSQQFPNVIVDLGDFHMIKEKFKIVGLLLQSSGFEKIVYQTRICTPRSLCGVMSGVHQNQVCRIHEVVSEELKRNFHKNVLHEKHPNIRNEPIDLASDKIDMATFESLQRGELLGLKFYDYRKNGYLGKTTQFCMIYMDFMRDQIQYQTAVQENNFELRPVSIESFILFYFYYSMLNYARYAGFYVHILKCIDKMYPGYPGKCWHL